MERRLRIFEMDEDADPVALAESRLLRDLFPREYAATRARRAIDLRPGHSRGEDGRTGLTATGMALPLA
jgi:hypothetical protein